MLAHALTSATGASASIGRANELFNAFGGPFNAATTHRGPMNGSSEKEKFRKDVSDEIDERYKVGVDRRAAPSLVIFMMKQPGGSRYAWSIGVVGFQ